MKRKTWRSGLTKSEKKHLAEQGCWIKSVFESVISKQKEILAKHNNHPQFMPCWTCRGIARKLGIWE